MQQYRTTTPYLARCDYARPLAFSIPRQATFFATRPPGGLPGLVFGPRPPATKLHKKKSLAGPQNFFGAPPPIPPPKKQLLYLLICLKMIGLAFMLVL